ncbi:GbsR/MarR family transcriptional regulator [Streptomyces sp. NPDC002851]
MAEHAEHAEQNEYGRDEAVVSRFVETFAAQMVEAGMTRMPSRVFAALMTSDEGVLTAAQLGERLKVSPAAVSGAIRYLSQVNMVHREREPGSRRERYRVTHNQWYEAMTNRDYILKRWAATMHEGVAHLGQDTPAGQRLLETAEFLEFLREELPGIMEKWRERQQAKSSTSG